MHLNVLFLSELNALLASIAHVDQIPATAYWDNTAAAKTPDLISLIKLGIFTHLILLKPGWNLTNLHGLKINYAAEKIEHCFRNNLTSHGNSITQPTQLALKSSAVI